jgi:hypothetical protein
MSERAMPKPNCTEAADVGVIGFSRLGRRVVQGRFDGSSMVAAGTIEAFRARVEADVKKSSTLSGRVKLGS